MPDLTDRHKRDLGHWLLELDDRIFRALSVPSPDSAPVRALAAELGTGEPMLVERRDDHLGLYGWPADGVRQRIAADGGSIRLGWRLGAWPEVLLIAEFHAVWADPDGTLVDITPCMVDGAVSLFLPVPNDPETLGQRPPTRYRGLYEPKDWSREAAARIAAFKPSQRAYEEKRALKAGKTLQAWVIDKYPADPLPEAVLAFIAACEAFDAKLPTLPSLIETRPDDYNEEDEGEWLPEFEVGQAEDAMSDWDVTRLDARMDIKDVLAVEEADGRQG